MRGFESNSTLVLSRGSRACFFCMSSPWNTPFLTRDALSDRAARPGASSDGPKARRSRDAGEQSRAPGTSSKPRGGAGRRRVILAAVAALPSSGSGHQMVHARDLPELLLGVVLSWWWAANVCRKRSAC